MDINALLNQSQVSLLDKDVTTLEEASLVAKEVAEIGKQLAAHATAYETELAAVEQQMKAIKQKYDVIMSPLQDKLTKYNEKLVAYHCSTLDNATEAEKDKLKSIKLPYGVTLSSRAKAPAYNVTNNDAYIAFAKTKQLVAVKEDVKWNELKKNLAKNEHGQVIYGPTGEVVDFIQIDEQERTFDVKW